MPEEFEIVPEDERSPVDLRADVLRQGFRFYADMDKGPGIPDRLKYVAAVFEQIHLQSASAILDYLKSLDSDFQSSFGLLKMAFDRNLESIQAIASDGDVAIANEVLTTLAALDEVASRAVFGKLFGSA